MTKLKEELKVLDYFKIGFGVMFLIILYLFACNGRYKSTGSVMFIDTWTDTIYAIDGDKIGKIGD